MPNTKTEQFPIPVVPTQWETQVVDLRMRKTVVLEECHLLMYAVQCCQRRLQDTDIIRKLFHDIIYYNHLLQLYCGWVDAERIVNRELCVSWQHDWNIAIFLQKQFSMCSLFLRHCWKFLIDYKIALDTRHHVVLEKGDILMENHFMRFYPGISYSPSSSRVEEIPRMRH